MLGTFAFNKVTCTLGGSRVAGFAKGTAISVEADEEDWVLETGADGHITRILKPNSTATVTFRIQQTSLTNDVLSAQRAVDRNTGIGCGVFLLKDLMGTTLLASENSMIQKPSKVEMGDEVTPREWTCILTDVKWHVGGNVL